MDYLRRILPIEAPGAYYCSARLNPKGGFIHRFFSEIAELHEHIIAMDRQGHTMYVAQAQFKTLENRKQENVNLIRSFFFDIDCGEGKPFATQGEALIALRNFVTETELPPPVVESSGNGLYARWILEDGINPEQWRVVGQRLKSLAAFHKFPIDPVRTADSASVLRPVGTHNRKNPQDPKDVRVVIVASDVSFSSFTHAVTVASTRAGLSTQGLTPPKAFTGLNDAFAAGIGDDHPPSDAEQVRSRCPAVKKFAEAKGDVAEPVWYDMIGLLRHCVNGEEVVQLWSEGHSDYSPAATAEKIQHHIDSGAGPTTCQKIGSDDATLCVACPHSGKIKSPIVLGYPLPKDLEQTEEEAQVLPIGYRRTDGGLQIRSGDDWQRFYPYDLYLTSYAKDHTTGKEVVTVRHQMPEVNGEKVYKEFVLNTETLHEPKELMKTLMNNHVHVPMGDPRKQMMGYLDNFTIQVRERRRLNELHAQMGWSKDNDDLVFVLGGDIFRREAEPVQAGLARSAPGVAKAFAGVGDVGAWSAATKYLFQPGMESLAFGFLAGAFGSPLMYFTGHSGAMVSLVGHSGLGKTMTGKWALSAYGDPELLMLQKDDTPASMISRLGIYGSLPAYIDEISNMEAGPLSDLVYRVTQGRERNRLTQRGEEKDGRTTWKTLALCSSNHPLADRLAALKTDASAEINRLLEIHVTTPDTFTAAHCRQIFGVFGSNHGGAGRRYVQYLVDHQDEHREKLDKLITELDRRSGALPEERFWIAIAAVTIYGALIAKKLSLIDADVHHLMNWVLDLIVSQRETKTDLVTSDVDIIGQFLDHFSANVLVTGRDAVSGMAAILKEPRGPLVARIMHEAGLAYLSRAEVRTYLSKSYSSYAALKAELTAIGALKATDRRKVLGSGTYFAGVAVTCWEIDLTVPALGRLVARLCEPPKVVEIKKIMGERG